MSPASAQTTIIGTVKDASGTALASGTIIFTLSQEGIVTDPALLITPPVTCTITAGVIQSCSLRGNDEISPAGTVYRVRIISTGGRTFLPERTYSITGATWDIGTQTPNPSSVQTGIHGASLHSGDVIPPANQEFGAFYSDFAQIAVPADPAAGIVRLFLNQATGEFSVRKSDSTTVSLEGGGGGGATHQIDGVDLTAQDPINFLDTSEFDWTNPAAGDLSLALKSASVADSKLAQITTASKVSGAALTLLGNVPAGAGDLPLANLTDGTGFLKGAGGAGTPAYTAIADADVPDTITLDNLTQITTRAITDLSGTAGRSQLPAAIAYEDEANAFTVGGQTITSEAIGVVPLLLKGFAGQTADLFKIQNSTLNDLFAVDAAGNVIARNWADQSLSFILDSGSTAQQGVSLLYRDRGVKRWAAISTASDQYIIQDNSNATRIGLLQTGGHNYNTAGTSHHDFFANNIRHIRIHGDSDKISFGAAADASIERTAAGVLDVVSIVDANTGFRIAGAAASGNYLRGNATNFVSSAIQTADIQELIAFADLTDIASTTGSGTVGVLGTNPTLTDVTIDDLLTFTETAGDATCAAGDYWLKGNSTSNLLRGCENGSLFTLSAGGGDGVGYDEVLDEGSGLTKRAQINFIGGGVTCVDNGGSTRTDCTIAGGGTSHEILSGTHTDTTTATVVRGDLMTGQTATPVWQRLAIGGANTFLGSDGTDATWTGLVLAGAQFVNQGTNIQVLHGNAAGNPSWGQVLPADIGDGGVAATFAFFSGAGGDPSFRAVADGDLPSGLTRDSESPNAAGDIEGTYSAGLTIKAGAVASAELATANKQLTVSMVLESPLAADDALLQHKFSQAVTAQRVSCSTDTGTVTIQLDERAEATPNTAGTDVMTSTLVCDNNTEATTSFSNAGIAADVPLNLDIDAVSGSPGVVRIHFDYQID